MKKIKEYLKKNKIEYRIEKFGNPNYYRDNFSVKGIAVKFDYELTSDVKEMKCKETAFLAFLKQINNYCIGYSGKAGIHIPWYTIFRISDFKRLDEHEKRIHREVEKFWETEHVRKTGKPID